MKAVLLGLDVFFHFCRGWTSRSLLKLGNDGLLLGETALHFLGGGIDRRGGTGESGNRPSSFFHGLQLRVSELGDLGLRRGFGRWYGLGGGLGGGLVEVGLGGTDLGGELIFLSRNGGEILGGGLQGGLSFSEVGLGGGRGGFGDGDLLGGRAQLAFIQKAEASGEQQRRR